jgi:hypothetical protein
MAISWEGNEEPALTTNTQGRRQGGGEADTMDLQQQIDRDNMGR